MTSAPEPEPPPARGLLDTSVFIARERERPLGELPALAAISVVTIGELQLGVLASDDRDTRMRRAATLELAHESDPITIDEPVIGAWARLVLDCRAAGIQRAVKLTDALIAATAVAHELPVVTQDDDFDRIAAAHRPLQVVRV